jgi:hypothetical protein
VECKLGFGVSSCDKCVERKDYVAEGPASETVDKFLKLDLKNNLSMSTAECISPTQKSSVFTHPYKPLQMYITI